MLLALIVFDIVSILYLYTIIISILVAMFALAIGFIGAYLLDKQFAPQLTAQAQYSFGSINSNKVIRLIAVDMRQIIFIVSTCIFTGLFSAMLPLIRNMRRSPIRDIREF